MKICPRCSELLPDDASFCPADGVALERVTDALVGRTVAGRYRIIRRLGAGGMANVYLARHVIIERLSAIKVLRPDLALDPANRERFLREARAVNRINHPNIVEITDYGEFEGLAFLVMEYVAGESLMAALKRGPFPWPRASHLAAQVGGALGRAHQLGVIHRDLKPENVILGRFGEVVVLDWGLAKVVGQADESATLIGLSGEALPDATQAGQALGTPAYMAPEQAEGRIDRIDRRTDIYGLGAILFEALTGKAPHGGGSTAELLRRIAQAETPLARSVEPTAPRALEAVCARAMARAPEARYESAAALAEDVQRWLADEPVAAYREPLRVRVGRKLRRYRGLVAAAAVVLVSVSTVSSVLAVQIYREKSRVEKAEQVAVREKVKAEEAEQVALAQSQVAMEALGNMVLEVQNELQDAPGAFLVRKAILNKALALLSRLNDTPATSDRVIRRRLLAHMQVGDIAWALGERDKAHQEYVLALQLAERAFAINPASDIHKGNVAAMQTKVGESEQFHHKRFDAARPHYEFALKTWEELTEKMRKFPEGDPSLNKGERLGLTETERALADGYDHVGKLYYAEEDAAKRDAAKAEELLLKSLAIRKRQLAADASRENLYRVGVSYLYLADNALKNNDIARTVTYNEELLKVRQAILKDWPTSLKAKRDLADALLRLGDVVWYAGQPQRAYALYQESLTWNEQVMWSEPDSPLYRGRVCQSHYCIGCGALKAGDRKLAAHHFGEALKLRERNYREYKAKNILDVAARSTLMLTLARCGEHRRAAELAAELRPRADARVLAEEIGPAYGICMAAIQGDRAPDQLTPEERALRDRYRDLALAAIQEGTAKGYNVLLYLEGDPDMEPLLALPEFRAWLAELKKGLKQK